MKINKAGLDLIKSYESFRSKPYLCPANVWTIGYGTTIYPNGDRVTKDDKPVTENEAMVLLMTECNRIGRELDKLIPERVDLTDNQISALISLIYNIGLGAFKKSTCLKQLSAGNLQEAGEEILRWHKAGGKSLPGLVRRRIEELYLYEKRI